MTKVDFEVLCLQVRGSREISEVQVRVCYYRERLFSFTQSSSQVCVGVLPCVNPTSLRADSQ